ncbi:MAG: flagellar M-ring protein FliF [Acidiphilium sp. 37-64-53]|uniref:flagellar basal-body MS-ring/collar protein FliF n=1 Tax=Acidiphilium TaxID=522 RepID=UPI000BC5E257|nr:MULTISPECIES: flagellar basal-body MS-ring/collar protein FliF [Acidiphilium]OYW02986.1 MAG: flagellar M-ring protein FliF [Acidiphilium sp. 37-64-53]OZB29358.1 MAG: flagellar M-ring protein FliF [Acidiphilium sp. 34-64-41]HQT86755.1 flagellar basal-body MS-ring/collar protein FliF [Acidiphilium rubrum]
MNKLIENLRALGPVKLGAMAAVAVGVLALMATLAVTGGPSPNATLYDGLGLKDASNITTALAAAHIKYEIGDNGHSIMVEPTQLDQARLLLAQHDLPAGSSSGFAIFDHQNPLTGSDFLDRIDETRAIDGELERTIDLIQGIRSSRVQVVLPQADDFSLHTAPAQASVMLSLAGAAPLDRQSIDAILNLVASAVPGLKPSNISIADDRGDLLAQAGRNDNAMLDARDASLKQATEQHLTDAVRSMLDAALGPNQVRVVTAVSMNFDRTAQTATSYDPNGQVVRSQQQSRTKSNRTENDNKTVSVANNLPGASTAPATPKSVDATSRTDQTTNYEISQTVKHTIHATPEITRISVAVMLDDVQVKGPKGQMITRPRSAATIARIQNLVQTAIGYDKARGDVVDVQSMAFANTNTMIAAPKQSLLARFMSSGMLMPLLRIVVSGLIALAALLVVFRPMVRRLTAPPVPASADAAIGGPNQAAIAGPDQEGADNPIRAIVELIDRNPEDSVAVIRGWLSQEGTS